MTALDKYIRLETIGRWKENPESGTKEVIVSFGNSTLVLSDLEDNPITHWALAATRLYSDEGARIIYTPDIEAYETLVIEDREMVEAIEQVSRATALAPKKQFNWTYLIIFIVVLFLLLAAYFLPTMLRNQAVSMTSIDSARQISMIMVDKLGLQVCHDPRADNVMNSLAPSLSRDTRMVITSSDVNAAVLPGNVILMSDKVLQSYPSAEALVDWVNTALDNQSGLVENLFDNASLVDTFQYITSGVLPDDYVTIFGKDIIYNHLVSTEVKQNIPYENLLRDQDWVAFQNVCLQ